MDRLFRYFAKLSASLVFVVLVATVIVLYVTAKPALEEFGAHFIVESRWGVDEIQPLTAEQQEALNAKQAAEAVQEPEPSIADDESLDDLDDFGDDDIMVEDEHSDDESSNQNVKTIYGGAVPIIGTVFSTIIAMLFAIPVAMGIAVFLSEIAHEKIAKPIGIAIELLAAIPSIIYGMWALFYFGPFISNIFGGYSVSLLIAGLVLGIMVIPFMAALSRDAINTTPDILKESAYAMGATKFEVVKDIIFPYAKAGIIGSIIVSLGRAMGETMAVAFVIGGIFKFADKVTDPTSSIPVVLANNFAESSGISMNALFYLALILFIVSFMIIFAAKHFLLRAK